MPGFPWRKEKPEVMARARKYPVELLERATRLVFESGRPITHVAADLVSCFTKSGSGVSVGLLLKGAVDGTSACVLDR